MSVNIKKGDTVKVIAGKDKGVEGRVIAVLREEDRVIVEGVNRVKKHTKPNPLKGTTGGIVEKAMPIHQSNVAIFNAATGKADRVGIKLLSADEKKSRKTQERGVRVFRSSGAEIKV